MEEKSRKNYQKFEKKENLEKEEIFLEENQFSGTKKIHL